jgi:hypothetical protein
MNVIRWQRLPEVGTLMDWNLNNNHFVPVRSFMDSARELILEDVQSRGSVMKEGSFFGDQFYCGPVVRAKCAQQLYCSRDKVLMPSNSGVVIRKRS